MCFNFLKVQCFQAIAKYQPAPLHSGSPNALKKYSARDPTDTAVASEDETLARVDTVNIEGGGGDTGLALRGMDCVSFHLIDASDPDGAPLQGSTDFEVRRFKLISG